MSDKTLICRDCGGSFVFTAGEQEFYAQKGFTNEPARCPSCRSARRAARGEGGYGVSSQRGDFDRSRREMFPAICSNCGRETEVPFMPNPAKPVYCQECFADRRRPISSGDNRGW